MPQKRVFAFPAGTASARNALGEALRRLDCIEVVDAMGDADVVIVLIGGPMPPEEELRTALSPAADGKFALVGVHDPDGDGSIPIVMEDWSTGGFYPLDDDALRAGLCDEDEGWLDPDGQPRAEPATKRECSRRNC